MWPYDQLHRAPVNDFPPVWASSWGDDEYGLWANLTITINGRTDSQKMRWIEPSQEGGFLMGSTQTERNNIEDKVVREWANQSESNAVTKYVKNGFWLANTPCTQSFWTTVVGMNPSHFKNLDQAANLPVENIAFKDDENKEASVEYFLELLNQNLQNINSSQLNPNVVIKADLPTEIEWEYACRADTQTAFWWGDEFNAKMANADSQLKTTSPVLSYPPNPWGLHDIHGNVWELTSSAFIDNETNANVKENILQRVLRGGAWCFHSASARAASRSHWPLNYRDRDQGLRILLRYS